MINKDNVYSVKLEGDYSYVYDLAKEYQKSGYGTYNLFTNNCLHYVKDLLKHSPDKNVAEFANKGTIVPRSFYNRLYIISAAVVLLRAKK